MAVRAVSNEMESLARRVFVATSKQDHDIYQTVNNDHA